MVLCWPKWHMESLGRCPPHRWLDQPCFLDSCSVYNRDSYTVQQKKKTLSKFALIEHFKCAVLLLVFWYGWYSHSVHADMDPSVSYHGCVHAHRWHTCRHVFSLSCGNLILNLDPCHSSSVVHERNLAATTDWFNSAARSVALKPQMTGWNSEFELIWLPYNNLK